jgi:transcriptional regulator with XRE-family HTH domain
MYTIRGLLASDQVHGLPRDACDDVSDNVDMAESKNHLRAWRKYRRMTQQALADAVEPPTTKQVIQALESGARGLSDKWLRRLAPALRTSPGFLLDYAPEELPTEFLDVVREIPKESQDQALAVLKTFRRTGTQG